MNKSKWVKRVNRFDTWFDKKRVQWKAEANGMEFEDIKSHLEVIHKETAIKFAYSVYCENSNITPDFSLTPQDMNLVLPKMLPNEPGFIDSVYKLIYQNEEFIEKVMENRESINEVLTDKEKRLLFILDYVDSATCSLYSTLLLSQDTEFMVMESDLTKRVLKSENKPIGAYDLMHVPFSQTFIEFDKPVNLIQLENGKKIDSIGVGFFKDEVNACYSAIWFLEDTIFKVEGVEKRVDSLLAVTFAPRCKLQRVIIDNPSRITLGFPETHSVGGNRFKGSDEDLKNYNKNFQEVSNQLLLKTRNIWDFITSRNIDYDLVTRGLKNMAGIRRYQHLQGKLHHGPRVFKTIKVNRTEKKYEKEDDCGLGKQTKPGMKEKIPASFHKWVYCADCGRTHRHDLIGSPCRRCKKQVGPFSNVEIKKWWHDEYWRGEGPIKPIVREFEN